MSETKKCRKCEEEKPLSEYKKGNWGVCTPCVAAARERKKASGAKGGQITKEKLAAARAEAEAAGRVKPRKSKRQLNVRELQKLLNAKLPMELRAELLCMLAQKVEDPVTALRALTTINDLTGINQADKGKTVVPLFSLPKGVNVKVEAEEVEVEEKKK